MTILPGTENERGWRNLLFGLTAITALIYLYNALFVPGTLSFAPFAIQDDARQFLAWMSRLDDSMALRGDLLADYWQSVCPWLYRLIFGAANAVGLEPNVFARLLPVALLALSAWMGWRVALLLTRRPVAAFVAAALLTGFVLHEDSIYSATPRAFSTPLFLVFLDGLLRNRGVQTIPALFLLGLLYPTTALVGLTMLGLSRIGWRPLRVDFGLRTWLLSGLGAVAVGAAIIPFAGATSAWEPTLSLPEALALPNLGTAEGRSAVVGLSGEVDLLCQARMGLLPEIVPCWSTSAAVLPNLLLMVPMLWLAWRAARRSTYRPDGEPGDLVHAWALIAAVAWWAVAIQVAFALHLPSRYTQRTLSILEFIAIGQLIGLWLDRRLRERPRSRGTLAGGGLLALFLLASFATPTPGISRPADEAAIARIAAMPADTIVGGVSDQLDYVPALTGRAALATIEHSIPYHQGYFRPLSERLEAGLAAVSSPDQAVLSDYVRRYGVDVIAVDPALIAYGELPPRWASVAPDALRVAQADLDAAPSVLQRRARDCVIHDHTLILLDADCLTRG